MRANTFRRLINLWPPFLFAGIRATRISADFHEVDVDIMDQRGEPVARVVKTLYIRRKPAARSDQRGAGSMSS